MDFRYKYGNQK